MLFDVAEACTPFSKKGKSDLFSLCPISKSRANMLFFAAVGKKKSYKILLFPMSKSALF
jgi:hypothetical protein